MERLDALEWASCVSYDILGQRVNVRSTCSEFAGRLASLLRSFSVHAGDGTPPDVTFSLVVAPPAKTPTIRPFHFLYQDGHQVSRTHHRWQLFRYLECQLDHILADQVTDRLLFHAGGVSKNGAGVIIPGESGSGKSSLTLALLEAGFEYFSDEVAVVDQGSGELHSFPKPVSIKNRTIFPELSQQPDLWFGPEPDVQDAVWYLHPEDLGATVAQKPAPVEYIVFRERRSGASKLEPLTPGEAMQRLIANSINLHRLGSNGFHLAADVVNEAQCFVLKSGDLASSVSLVNELVEN